MESWDQKSLAGAPSALLKLIPTRATCFSLGNVTECCLDSPSGTMCERSMAVAGEARSTWLRAASRAKISAWPAAERVSTGSEADCGTSLQGSFATFNRHSCSSRTLDRSSPAGSQECSKTFPEWGSMRNGECFELAPVERHTCDEGCSYWPTPTATMAKSGFGHGKHSQGRYRSSVLERCAKIGWSASPEMLEAVLGWPVGWTEHESLEMDKFREWLRLHSKPWHEMQHADSASEVSK